MDLERTTQPMTLVEKLRNKRNEWASNPHYWMDSNLIGDVFSDVIRTVEAHSDWVRCDERLPKNPMFYLVDEEGEYFKARYFRGRWETSEGLWVYPEFWFGGIIRNPRKSIPVILSEQAPSEPQYLISKGGYWYRPNAKGYTASKHEAGRFSKEFAERHAKEVPEVRIFEDKENS